MIINVCLPCGTANRTWKKKAVFCEQCGSHSTQLDAHKENDKLVVRIIPQDESPSFSEGS